MTDIIGQTKHDCNKHGHLWMCGEDRCQLCSISWGKYNK